MQLNSMRFEGRNLLIVSYDTMIRSINQEASVILTKLTSIDELKNHATLNSLATIVLTELQQRDIMSNTLSPEDISSLQDTGRFCLMALVDLNQAIYGGNPDEDLSFKFRDVQEEILLLANQTMKCSEIIFHILMICAFNGAIKDLLSKNGLRVPSGRKEIKDVHNAFKKRFDELEGFIFLKRILALLQLLNTGDKFVQSGLITRVDDDATRVKYDVDINLSHQPMSWVPGYSKSTDDIEGVFISRWTSDVGDYIGEIRYQDLRGKDPDYMCDWLEISKNNPEASSDQNEYLNMNGTDSSNESDSQPENQNEDPNSSPPDNQSGDLSSLDDPSRDKKGQGDVSSASESNLEKDQDSKVHQDNSDSTPNTPSSTNVDPNGGQRSNLHASLVKATDIDPKIKVTVLNDNENALQSSSGGVNGEFYMDPHDNRLRYKSSANPNEFRALGSSTCVAELKFLDSMKGCEITIKIPAGLTIICGRSSSGKSTLLRAIMDQVSSIDYIVGFLEPDECSLSDGDELQAKLNSIITQTDVFAIDSARYFMYGGRSSALPGAINGAFFNMMAELSSNLARDKKALIMVVNPLTGDRETELLSKIVESIKGSATAMIMIEENATFIFESRLQNKRRNTLVGRTTDVLMGSAEFRDLAEEEKTKTRSIMSDWEQRPTVEVRETVQFFGEEKELF